MDPNSKANPAPVSTPRFGAAYVAYMVSLNAENVTPKHLQNVAHVRTEFIRRMGDSDLATITADDVRTWLLWLQGKDEYSSRPPAGVKSSVMSSAGVDRHFRTLKAFFAWCEAQDVIRQSPFRKVKRPKVTRRIPDVLTEADVFHLLDRVRCNGDRNSYRDYCIHLLLLDTGIRLNECYRLDVGDLDLSAGVIRIRYGKGRKERLATLGLECRKAIGLYLLRHRRALAGEVAVFVTEYGARLAKSSIQHIVTKDLKKYIHRDLVRWGPHTHRHTFVTLDLRHGGDLKRTSKRAGHSSVQVTEGYEHLVLTDILRTADQVSPIDTILKSRCLSAPPG